MSLFNIHINGKALPNHCSKSQRSHDDSRSCAKEQGCLWHWTLPLPQLPRASGPMPFPYSAFIHLIFFTSICCLNITTWVMYQHCMELDQQLSLLITLLMFAFDCISTKEKIMSYLSEDITKHFRIGVGRLKSSARRRAISSNTLCFSSVWHAAFLMACFHTSMKLV